MSCSRPTCWAIAEVANAISTNPPSNAIEQRTRFFMIGVSLVLYLQAVRADIDLQALRFLLALVEIVAEHAYHDDQRADDKKHNIAIAGHSVPPEGANFRRPVYGRGCDSESDLKRLQNWGKYGLICANRFP